MTTRPSSRKPPSQDDIEIWEAVSQSTVWIFQTDRRGRDVPKAVGGPGNPKRIRITTQDREYNQDQANGVGPFDNGLLRRVDGSHSEDMDQPAKTDAQLLGMLQNAEDLEELLMEELEVNVRRLALLAEGDAADKVSMSAAQTIRRVIDARWPKLVIHGIQDEQKARELF